MSFPPPWRRSMRAIALFAGVVMACMNSEATEVASPGDTVALGKTVSTEASTAAGDSRHWAFQPVKRPPIPQISRREIGNPIDSFVNSALEKDALEPSSEADRTVLIRRLYLVMLGVPPSPEEVEAFLADRQSLAFERLVDRVLADTRYGEKWGRHWLDVIRFAESNGFETNRERPTAWRFRDYVIAAFNEDKPYDRFIREQIAGDVLGVDVGTGFLVGGPFDIVKSPDPVLTAQQRADELDDMVATTGTAFLGLTLGCARCHSHKFDPVSHKEYYGMAAFFSGVRHGEKSLPLPSGQADRLAGVDRRMVVLEEKLKPFLVKPPGGRLLAPLNPRENIEAFAPVLARRVRLTIRGTTGGEPCVDEFEIWSGTNNVASSALGTRATASGTLPGFEIHRLEHIHDGKVGNAHSWISSEPGRGWVTLEFPRVERIEKIVWSRDRDGAFKDRLATDYVIEVAENDIWKVIVGSADHEPAQSGPPAVRYDFAGVSSSAAEDGRKWFAEWEGLKKERESLAKAPTVWAGNFAKPAEIHRLHRGDPMQKREPVAPATLELFNPVSVPQEATEQERRLALADWIASPSNPLTARVIVNRLWQHHFGTGLVDTPNDFGKNGSRPSHPELLDWLAAELMDPKVGSEDGRRAPAWSMKHLQRLILTSATWRRDGRPRDDAMKVDAATRKLWRFPPRRLEAESIRDGILSVSGNLDRTGGGPSFFLHDVDRENVYHYHPKEDFGPAETRRMVYAFKVRMEQDGVFGAFDCPDGSLVMPRRSVSTTPLQALNLFNSRFMIRQSEVFALRLKAEAGSDHVRQIERAWQLAYQRAPSKAESDDAAELAGRSGMPAVCRALMNSNEFLFVP